MNAAATPPPESFGHIDESDGEVIIIVGFVAIIAVALLAGFCSQARKSGDVSWRVEYVDLDMLLDRLEPLEVVLTIFIVLKIKTLSMLRFHFLQGEDAHYLHNRGKTTASVRSLFSILMLSMIRDRLARVRREELRRKQGRALS